MEYGTLNYELDDHVAVLTYDRPEQRNAVSREMNAELHHAWRRFRDDPEAFVLVITGAGDAFCAGWDLQDAAEWPRPDWDEFRTHLHDTDGVCGYTRRADVFKPVIAAVNGWAVAAGLENALLADIRIVAENAVFGALERRWNIVAGDGMTVRLPLVVGWAKAMELIITGRAVDAEEALRIGLANEVVPEGRSLERALELAREIAALPQGAIRTDKETMIRNLGRTVRGAAAPGGGGGAVDVLAPRLARDRRQRVQGGPRPGVASPRALSRSPSPPSRPRVAIANQTAPAVASAAAAAITARTPNASAAGPVSSRPIPPAPMQAVTKASIAFARSAGGARSVIRVLVGALTTGLASRPAPGAARGRSPADPARRSRSAATRRRHRL